jgi:DNA polymerase-3 subunit epsilon
MDQIVLDTETTGIGEGHRIIEIGAVQLINRRFTGKHFHYYLNPDRDIDAGAQAVHGITAEFLADKPRFGSILDEFLAFIKNAELIIHNAPFDLGFLNIELNLHNKTLGKITEYCHSVVDTLPLARQRHPGQKNNLDALCKRYNIDNTKRDLHGALLDAQLLAHVYLAMTGGQGTLFAEEKAVTQTPVTTSLLNISQRKPLPVIQASPEELALHKQRLADIQKISKNCLWLNSEPKKYGNIQVAYE